MKVFLIVLFNISGQTGLVENWEPRQHESFMNCREHVAQVRQYLTERDQHGKIEAIGCYAGRTEDEALAVAFRHIGDDV